MLEVKKIEDLEKYKCPIVKVEGKNIAEIDPELIYSPILPSDDRFVSRYDKEALQELHIVMKTFDTDLLLPMSYKHRDQMYSSYNNFIDYSVEYQTLHLLQINVYRGVNVLKQSDQQHLHRIVLDTESLFFRYDHEFKDDDGVLRPKWRRVAKVETWMELQREIEELKNGTEVQQIIKNYFLSIKSLQSRDSFIKNHSFIFKSLLSFYRMKNLFNELEDQHYQLLRNTINHISKEILENERRDIEDYKKIEKVSTLYSQFVKVGYYISNEKAYPNAMQHYLYSQKSDHFRNERHIQLTQKEIFTYGKSKNVSFVETNDINFQNFFAKLHK